MSYRIHYLPEGKQSKRKRLDLRRGILTMLCFLLFLTAVYNVWPQAVHTVSRLSHHFSPAVLVSAMEEMALSLQEGSNVKQSCQAFMQHILQKIRLAAD